MDRDATAVELTILSDLMAIRHACKPSAAVAATHEDREAPMSLNTELKSLGYIGVRSDKLSDWSEVATKLLGMQVVDQAKNLRSFRMDDRKQRYIVSDDGESGLGFMGWEVEAQRDLDTLAAKLEAHGVRVMRGSRSLAEQRRVADLITFSDPGGNRLEAFGVRRLPTRRSCRAGPSPAFAPDRSAWDMWS
jgi:hypothetical protein